MSRELLLSFAVGGEAIPQGSKTVYNGRAVDANAKKLRPWRRQVTGAAKAAAFVAELAEPLEGALALSIEFVFVRPKTAKRALPHVKPDLDKLIRAINDSLTDAGVWKDDGQVTTISARKIYGPTPGARVSVYREKE